MNLRNLVTGILLVLLALSAMGLVGAIETDNFTPSITRHSVER